MSDQEPPASHLSRSRLLLGALVLVLAGGAGFLWLKRERVAQTGKGVSESGENANHAAVTAEDTTHPAAGHGDRESTEVVTRIRSMLKLKEGEIGMVSAPHGTFGHHAGPDADGRVVNVAAILDPKDVAGFLKATLSRTEAAHPGFQVVGSGEPLKFHAGDVDLATRTFPDTGDNIGMRLTTEAGGREQETALQLQKGAAIVISCGNSDMVLITGKDDVK